MAPEIVGGALPTPESDVYAIGAMMFELLTGRQPYYAVSSRALLQEHVNRAVPDVRSLNPSVPDVLSKIIQKAMHKNPAMRYQGAHDLLADLRLVQEALRFGKSLVWPLRPEAPDEVTIEPGPVAPRMSAIRETPSEEKVKKRRHERDVPTWMLLTMTFLGAVLLMLIGFYTIENLRRPRTVRVPNITMLSVAEARDMLAKLKLELRVQSREPNERVEADRVLSASPAPGREVRERGVVNVVVSAGSSTILMPDLKGETLDKARTILENLSLNPEPLTEQRSSSEVEFGRVIDTDPPAKTKVLRKTRVKLVISAGSVADPSEISKSFVYSLRITVSDTTDNTLVRVEISDIQGARTVYEGTHQPEDTIECEATGYGGSATFRIYYDDRLVKEFEQRAQR
jgi:serine/threonine-protein kinase